MRQATAVLWTMTKMISRQQKQIITTTSEKRVRIWRIFEKKWYFPTPLRKIKNFLTSLSTTKKKRSKTKTTEETWKKIKKIFITITKISQKGMSKTLSMLQIKKIINWLRIQRILSLRTIKSILKGHQEGSFQSATTMNLKLVIALWRGRLLKNRLGTPIKKSQRHQDRFIWSLIACLSINLVLVLTKTESKFRRCWKKKKASRLIALRANSKNNNRKLWRKSIKTKIF